uniref:Uncharacterized protein n=1 Tax=Amphimedon queenslandica TaxID=400682 RepID=A0A1X7VGM3_AMPQE
MALTATATHKTYKVVRQRLSLLNQKLTGCQQNRSNIKYEVRPLEILRHFVVTLLVSLRFRVWSDFFQRYSDYLLCLTLRRKLPMLSTIHS